MPETTHLWRAIAAGATKTTGMWDLCIDDSLLCAGAGVIEGFAVSAAGRASLLWSVAFPPSTDAILATATPGLHDPVYSYAKVGDCSHPAFLCTFLPSCSLNACLSCIMQECLPISSCHSL